MPIRDVQPQGPYRLAGWSAGNTIAFEIARQLLAADAKVEFLVMIDTDADYRSLFESESTGALVVNLAAEFDRIDALLMLLPSSAPPAVRDEVAGLARARDFQRMIEVFQARSYVPAKVEGTVLERHLALRHALALSLYEYRPVALPSKATLFSASSESRADATIARALQA